MGPRIIAVSLVAVLLVAAPATAAQDAAGAGTASTSLDLAELSVTGLPVSGLDLGGLTSYASTVPDAALNALGEGKPFALSAVRLPVGGEVTVRSDGNTGRPGQTIDLGVGSLTIGDLLAVVDDDTARSVINVLSGTVDVGLAGLQVGATGVTSVVTDTTATATNGAVLHDLSVDLTDILPLDLLAQLPLDVLIGLLDGLGIDLNLPATLSGVLRDVRELVDGLEAVETAQATVDALQNELAEAEEELAALVVQLEAEIGLLDAACDIELLPGLDLGGAVDDLLGDGNISLTDPIDDLLDEADDLLDDVDGLPGGVGGLSHDACHPVQETVDSIVDVQGMIDDLQDALDDAIALLSSLLDELLSLIEGLDLSQLTNLLGALLDNLAGTELLSIDRLSVGVTSFADAEGSNASVVCDLRGLAVLGQPVAGTCEALEQALGDVGPAIEGLLAGLPIVGSVTGTAAGLPGDVVKVSAPRLHSSSDNQRDGDYYVSSAGVQGLALDVASLQLTQVTDGLLGDLLAQVDGLLGEVEGLTGITVDLAALDAALDAILAVVDGLPRGDLLGGLATPGLSLAALDLDSGSRFSAAGTGIVPVPPAATPTPPAQTPTPPPALPTTGGGVAGALLLLLAGGAVTRWLRRRPLLSEP
jgi:hypothetical protein